MTWVVVKSVYFVFDISPNEHPRIQAPTKYNYKLLYKPLARINKLVIAELTPGSGGLAPVPPETRSKYRPDQETRHPVSNFVFLGPRFTDCRLAGLCPVRGLVTLPSPAYRSGNQRYSRGPLFVEIIFLRGRGMQGKWGMTARVAHPRSHLTHDLLSHQRLPYRRRGAT